MALFGLVLSIITIGLSPIAWQDESQILSLGMSILGDENGSLYIALPQGGVAHTLAILGSALSYFSFEVVPGNWGHRFLALSFAIICGFLLYKISRVCKNNQLISTFLGVILLFEPSIAQSYRGGRVDTIAFSFILLAILLIVKQNRQQLRRSIHILTGASIVLAMLSWTSALIVTPFIFLFFLHENLRFSRDGFTEFFLKDLVYCSIGGAFVSATAYLISPDYLIAAIHNTSQDISNMSSLSRIGAGLQNTVGAGLLSLPVIGPILFIFFLFWRINRHLLITFAGLGITYLLAAYTGMYVHRLIYVILPFLALCATLDLSHTSYPIVKPILCFAALYAFGVTGVTRNYVALTQEDARSYANAVKMINNLGVKRGELVYDGTWHFFLGSKQAGYLPMQFWGKQLGNLQDSSNPITLADWIILPSDFIREDVETLLAAGYSERRVSTFSQFGDYIVLQKIEVKGTNPE
jgi:hypothetical protein